MNKSDRLIAEEMKLKHEKELIFINNGLDLDKRVLTIEGEINEDLGPIIRMIKLLKERSDERITVYIRSGGGCVYSGLALYDALKESGLPITTVCEGIAMSMGLILFLVGDKRLATSNARFMAHTISGGIRGNMDEMETDIKESKRLNDTLMKVIEGNSTKTKKYWKAKMKNDFYFGREEALKLGIVTE